MRFMTLRSLVLAVSAPLFLSPLSLQAHGEKHDQTQALSDALSVEPSVERSDEGHQDGVQNQLQSLVHSSDPTLSVILRPPAPQTMSPALGGSWSPVYDWPLVAIHAALLPTGKVLSWDATPDDSDDDPLSIGNDTTRVTLWDPVSNTHVSTNNDTGTDLFCAGSAHLWDGRILFAGGDVGVAGANAPLADTNIYDPVTNTWRRTADMNAPRWYSSVAALANGEMLTLGGSYQGELVSEVFQFDQTWRALSNANPTSGDLWWLQTEEGSDSILFDYQWIQATPDGSVMTFGPQNILASIDTEGQGSWIDRSTRDNVELRDYGSYAMYDVGKILVSGGGESLDTAVVIDTATQQSSDTGVMNIGRRQHNLTILADGSVLVTGGNTDGARFYSPETGVKEPEIWNPATGQFSLLNPMQADRQYHSTALLLMDGRVLSGGGGICGDCYALGYEERNAEIFTPPYLYSADATLAVRPELSNVPAVGDYAGMISVSTDAQSTIERAHLIKLGSVTHSENQDQRLVPLALTQDGSSVRLTLPASRQLAPPGHYLLFVIDDQGVPSEGGMIKIGQPLVGVGEPVVSTLEVSAIDTYAFEVEANQAFTAQVASATPDAALNIFITPSAPLTVADLDPAQVPCMAGSGEPAANCSIESGEAATWYVSITGEGLADYRLETVAEAVSSASENTDPSTGGESTGRVTTGGMLSVPVVFFMLLLGLGRYRRRSLMV